MNPINSRRAFIKSCAVLGAVGAAGILLPGCEKKDTGGSKSAAVIKGRSDQVVQFKYPDNPTFDLVYVADSLGYFEGTRARPNYIGRIAAPQVIPLTGTGEIDFGARMVPLVISAIASGLDLKVVAAGGKVLEEAPHMRVFRALRFGHFQTQGPGRQTGRFQQFLRLRRVRHQEVPARAGRQRRQDQLAGGAG